MLFDDNNNTTTPPQKSSKRKNNPELLRHTILVCAKDLMIAEGLASFSLQKVADMAGTSKGGLFHHFKSKEALMSAVLELYIAQLNTAILAHIAAHAEQSGMLTRAYMAVFFQNTEIGLSSDWAGLIRIINAEPHLFSIWQAWQDNLIKQYAHTDNHIRFAVIRHAIHGLWINYTPNEQAEMIYQYLLTLIDKPN